MNKQEAIQELLKQGTLPTPGRIAQLTGETCQQADTPQKEEDTQTIERKGTSVEVLKEFNFEQKKITVKDFANLFRQRYSSIRNILFNRPAVSNAVSINRLETAQQNATIIAIISDIDKMHTGTLKLTLEDLSGTITAIISAKKEDLIKEASFICADEVLAFKGGTQKGIFFVDEIIWPDIPNRPIVSCSEEVYAAFSGDIHAGSNMFLPENLQKFIDWLGGKEGTDRQKEIAKKTKYVFFIGDIVDGIGIYPGQEKELHVKDIYEQYKLAAKFLAQIPKDKQIIIIPGNHDAMRIAEPQPRIYKDFAAPIYELPNVISLSNPAVVRIHNSINVLLYHGYSFDYFINNVEGLRLSGGYDRPDKTIEFLLKRRHLAPTYGSTLYLPMKEDPLMIYQVPDVVATGHIHKAKISQYNGVITIAASCWQDRTSFQEKVGHHPDPSMVPLLNLKTRKTTMLDFS